MTAKEDPIYVGIENPAELRKALLESSKSMIHILQANEKLKARRKQKEELNIELKETMKELTQLVAQLKAAMPKVKLSSLPKKEKTATERTKPIPAQERQQRPRPKPRPIHLTEAQKLERELKDIEDKLSKL